MNTELMEALTILEKEKNIRAKAKIIDKRISK